MPTPQERNALLFLSVVAFLGAGARAAGELSARESVTPAAERALAAQLQAVEQKQQAKAAGKRKPAAAPKAAARTKAAPREPDRPLSPIDVDRAPAAELQRLPRIGPALAARIVADRDSLGPFGSLTELQRVRGVGPAMVRELAPYVTFSGTPRPMSAARTHHRRASPP